MIVKRLKRFPFFDHRYRIAVGRLDIQFRINIDGGKILDTACLCQNGWDIVIEVSKKLLAGSRPVSYTHLTLPPNREV